jgi:hypothetical protein
MDPAAHFLKELRNSYQDDEESQLTSLRHYNTALLEQISELRKADLERDALQKALGEQQVAFSSQKEDLTRKLAVLADEKWAHNLQLQGLEALRTQDGEEIQRLKNQASDFQHKLEELALQKDQELEQSREKYEALLAAQAQQVEQLVQQNNQNIEMFQTYETQMKSEVSRTINEMQATFKGQVDLLLADNEKLRQILNVRDNQDNQQRETLKLWQDQLRTFDAQLNKTKEKLKLERTHLLRLSAQLENEIRLSPQHPFEDYIEISEREKTRLQNQIASIAAISPLRPKLEERLAHLSQQIEAMQKGLKEVKQRSEERLQALSSLTQSKTGLDTVLEED